MSELTNTSTTVETQAAAERARPRWGRIIAWSSLIGLLIIVGFGLYMAQQGPVSIGNRAPNFTMTTFEGDKITLESLRGKVVVINFWASWCKPCEEEAADLEAAWRYYQPRGDVVFLGIDYVDTEREAKAYLQKFDITYPNGPDLGTRISHRFRILGVPETYIIDQDGILVNKKISPYRNLNEIKGMIDPLLD